MIKMDVKFNARTTLDKLKTVRQQVLQVPQDALDYFISITPIDTGNARRSTYLSQNKTIVGNYAYAKPLDEGYSKQAPKGMIAPTEKFIRERIKKITGR